MSDWRTAKTKIDLALAFSKNNKRRSTKAGKKMMKSLFDCRYTAAYPHSLSWTTYVRKRSDPVEEVYWWYDRDDQFRLDNKEPCGG